MKKSIAKKWVKALRSGKYEQGRGALYKDGKYCCLGVLDHLRTGSEPSSSPSRDELLSKGCMEWSGLGSNAGCCHNHSDNLASLNDNGMTFDEIADIIEREWESL